MTFFRNFPFVNYNFGDEINPAIFQNLTTYVDVIDQVKDDLAFYETYYIRDNMRPDNLSYELYGTQDYYWMFYLINDFLRLQGWPLTEQEIHSLSKKYYPNITMLTNEAMHGKFYVGDTIATAPVSNPSFKAIILDKNYDLGQMVIKPLSEVRSITLDTPGSGYTTVPTITLTGGSGYGAKAAAAINDSGQLTTITVTSSGYDYTTAPTVTISMPDNVSGTTATATAVLTTSKQTDLGSDIDMYSEPGEPDTTLWNTDTLSPIRFHSNVSQDKSIHHYEDLDGNHKDLTILTDTGMGVDNTSTTVGDLTKVRYIDRLLEENNALRNIKVFTPEIANQINAEYQRLLKT